MRETLRVKETALRRAEQEVDSLGFRNKQLEHRVASLQEDLERETKLIVNRSKFSKNKNDQPSIISNRHGGNPSVNSGVSTDPIFTEELQKKIIENAQLISLLADKDSDINLYKIRINELEQQLTKCVSDHTDLERKLRKENDMLIAKNSSLESKIAEGISIVGSEDALSVSECEHTHTPIHRNSTTTTITTTILNNASKLMHSACEERILQLEKDIFHWKTKYEICKISSSDNDNNEMVNKLPPPSSNGQQCSSSSCSSSDDYMSTEINESTMAKEQLIYNHFMKKLDSLFAEKNLAESKVNSYIIEVTENCLSLNF